MSTSGNAAQSARYGERVTEIPDALAPFLQHRSIRKFKPDPIPDALMMGLIAAAQSASTSSNLQLWTAISVDEPTRREQIAQLCGNQNQVRHAARFLAFFADHHRILEAAKAVGEPCAGADFEEFYIMAIIDAALAAERLVCAAESIGLGICYIGALRNDPPAIQALLNTPNQTVGLFGLCLGWPEEPNTAHIKPRLRPEAVWHKETYGETLALTQEYDRRMQTFYESEGMQGEVTWSMRSGKRMNGSEKSMSGREVLRAWVDRMGFRAR